MNYAGIDLGTHTTQIGTVDAAGQPSVLSTPTGEQFFRSVVFFDDDGSVLVGSDAENAGLIHPDRVVTNWKRSMGTDTVLYSSDSGIEYRAVDIAKILLDSAKEIYKRKTGQILTHIAIAIPANYTDLQRDATKQAARLAGLELICLRHEPTCAALGNQVTKRRSSNVVILDLGGGTFDVSVVSISGNHIEVLVTNGIPKLGGADYSRRLLEAVLEDFKKQHGFAPTPEKHPIEFQNLVASIEQTKRNLSAREHSPLTFSCEGKAYARKVTRSMFASLTEDLTEHAMAKAGETLSEAGISSGEIDEFIPVGGGSLVPSFLSAIETTFGKPPSQHSDPNFSVVLGVTEAGLLQKEEEDGEVYVSGRRLPSRETFLTDVTPHPFGVCVCEDGNRMVNEVILNKGVRIPSTHTERFQLEQLGQTSAHIKILQGKAHAPVEDCALIGDFFLDDLTPISDRPHGIEISLHITRDGMLAAKARSLVDGRTADLSLSYDTKKKGA